MARKKTGKAKKQSTQQKKTAGNIIDKNISAFEIVTIIIALWGAILSTWIFIQNKIESTPKLFIKMDAQAKGRLDNNDLIGDISISVTNIGSKTITIAPSLLVFLTNSRNGKIHKTQAYFNIDELNTSERFRSPSPVTLKVGETAIANTNLITNKIAFDPMDYHSVMLHLSSGETFMAFFSAEHKYSIKRDVETNELMGWSTSSIAEKK